MQYVSCILLLLSSIAFADQRVKIAIIDTGMPENGLESPYFCDSGHKDFSGTGIIDRHGHGTMVANSIAKHIDPVTHCIVALKWIDWDRETVDATRKINRIAAAVSHATAINAKYINMSLYGPSSDSDEKQAIETALARGIVVAVAAGNDGHDLSKMCDAYPACYAFKNKNFIVVANYLDWQRIWNSNYGGPVNATEFAQFDTSQATAIYLGKLIRGIYETKCSKHACPAPSNIRMRR